MTIVPNIQLDSEANFNLFSTLRLVFDDTLKYELSIEITVKTNSDIAAIIENRN